MLPAKAVLDEEETLSCPPLPSLTADPTEPVSEPICSRLFTSSVAPPAIVTLVVVGNTDVTWPVPYSCETWLADSAVLKNLTPLSEPLVVCSPSFCPGGL